MPVRWSSDALRRHISGLHAVLFSPDHTTPTYDDVEASLHALLFTNGALMSVTGFFAGAEGCAEASATATHAMSIENYGFVMEHMDALSSGDTPTPFEALATFGTTHRFSLVNLMLIGVAYMHFLGRCERDADNVAVQVEVWCKRGRLAIAGLLLLVMGNSMLVCYALFMIYCVSVTDALLSAICPGAPQLTNLTLRMSTRCTSRRQCSAHGSRCDYLFR